MASYPSRRIVEQINVSSAALKDFTPRRPTYLHRILYKLCLLFLVVSAGVTLIVYEDNELAALIVFQVGCLLFVVGKQSSEYQQTMRTKDFVTALFSSALCAGYEFCLMVERATGKIIYLDRPSQELFPDMNPMSKRMLEDLLATHVLSSSERDTVLQALKRDTASHARVQMQVGSDNASRTFVIAIEPIARPEGYCLIRGKA